ncbi:ABC transporter ATP-binding protein [Heyndrickxia oleronia]|uniref:Spermidine/putrescine import ATP-binding protein PotA n=2 Tax=Heyndrickxia oleronia TaxID=38875 RepID=A0A8E2I946_9BACI|nr:ABC transporter ATP-binding protein [Heyndrickxia oleronia]MEC1375876.1 ABC transporter ATP-binding protein [Heyndrickxia oleronia]OOP68235.1 Fe3+/spermidine/putrescine ABC transporter ATP-binding protein [Heyndrickxia oleronia]QQZ05591.1 ABC transporter ATP-binding protein [Heyndrickxia oleronia]
MSYLSLQDIVKSFNQVEVVKQLSLDIQQGELISFLGPSGCGKTTTLNMIAGFLDVDGGRIMVDGAPVHLLPPNKREMGMVFQNYALFPHMTVFNNVAYGLKLRKVPNNEIKIRVAEALEMVRLSAYENRYPRELSGGQQQRVSLARALVVKPKVLLLDEPLSNLDAKLRQEMREEIVTIQKQVKITTIFVTHDQEEALAISDRIAVMNEGCIEQVDDPTTIYNHPKTDFVSKFIGEVNQVQGNVLETFENNVCKISFYGNEQFVPVQTSGNKEMSFFIRPERIKISQEEGGNSFQTRVERKIFLGSKTRYILNVKEKKLIADISNTELNPHHIEEGENVYTYWEPEDLLPSKEVS